MKKGLWFIVGFCCLIGIASPTFSAYQHFGDIDSPHITTAYSALAGTKLDSCALCHSGGEYERRPGVFTTLGSCQWCHHSYGYDESGDIMTTLNRYGIDYLTNGRNVGALTAIAGLDSDGDGFSNADEIAAVRYPGSADDDPTKTPAPFRVYARAELEALPRHTQFMLMNTTKSGDSYAEYAGVTLETLFYDAGMLAGATGVTVFAPDAWSQFHPLTEQEGPELYHVIGTYPEAQFHYVPEADIAVSDTGWCDYASPAVAGRMNGDTIEVANGLRAMLAFLRDGASLTTGALDATNRLDGEGPYRLVVPQKSPNPPDQASTAENQNVVWPYNPDWDHNAGACTRSVTMIRVEPLPEGTTDIDILEAGWNYIDSEQVIVYGAVAGKSSAETLPMTEVMAVDTHESRSWTSFAIGDATYLAAANQADYSVIYRMDGDALTEVQRIDIPWVEVFESVVISGETYLAMALNRNADDSSRLTDSIVYKWNGAAFAEFQRIPTLGARDFESFEIDGVTYLAVANERSDDTRNVDSVIYRWDAATATFIPVQSIPTKGARDWEHFEVNGETYLAIANQEESEKDRNPRDIDSVIYRWNGSEFVAFQSILTHSARDWESVTVDGVVYLAMANNQLGRSRVTASYIYKWNGAGFSPLQSVLSYGAHDWSAFTVDGDTYLALANNKNNETPTVHSKIFRFENGAFAELQSVETQGIRDWEAFTANGATYLIAANDDDEYENENILSRIYRVKPAATEPTDPAPTPDDDDDDDTCFIRRLLK